MLTNIDFSTSTVQTSFPAAFQCNESTGAQKVTMNTCRYVSMWYALFLLYLWIWAYWQLNPSLFRTTSFCRLHSQRTAWHGTLMWTSWFEANIKVSQRHKNGKNIVIFKENPKVSTVSVLLQTTWNFASGSRRSMTSLERSELTTMRLRFAVEERALRCGVLAEKVPAEANLSLERDDQLLPRPLAGLFERDPLRLRHRVNPRARSPLRLPMQRLLRRIRSLPQK